jgi:hypothetical protein
MHRLLDARFDESFCRVGGRSVQQNLNIVRKIALNTVKGFRKLLIRYEKKDVNYLALLQFACAIMVWRQIIPVYPGLIPG